MNYLQILIKVTTQDILIAIGFLLVSCGIGKLDSIIGGTASYYTFMFTWPILLLLFFYSNAELVKWVKNTYVWALAAMLPSILLVTLCIGFVVHNPCKIPFVD